MVWVLNHFKFLHELSSFMPMRRKRGQPDGGLVAVDDQTPMEVPTVGGGVARRQRQKAIAPSTTAIEAPENPLPQQMISSQEMPLNARLLSCFGGFTPEALHTLENFFAISLRFSREDIIGALVALSLGMTSAVDTHTAVKNDILLVNGRAERMFEASKAADRLCNDLRIQLDEAQVLLLDFMIHNFVHESLIFGVVLNRDRWPNLKKRITCYVNN